jgi:hypothetical protein
MKNRRPLIYASAAVLLAFIAVGLSTPACEDGTIKSLLTNTVLLGAFPLAGIYLGLKSKKNDLVAYAAWGLLFSIPAISGYLYFAFGLDGCIPLSHILVETLKRGLPLYTLLATGIPLAITYKIKNRTIQPDERGQ